MISYLQKGRIIVMTNDTLLHSISAMMDEKFTAFDQQMDQKFDVFCGEFDRKFGAFRDEVDRRDIHNLSDSIETIVEVLRVHDLIP